MTFPYQPGDVPDDPKDLAGFLRDEFWALKSALELQPQTKILTGTSGAVGTTVTVDHGLKLPNIVACRVLIATAGGNKVGPDKTAGTALAYTYNIAPTTLNIVVDAAGANVASMPFTALITYSP